MKTTSRTILKNIKHFRDIEETETSLTYLNISGDAFNLLIDSASTEDGVKTEQDFDNETTTYTFEDGSTLRITTNDAVAF